MSQRILGFISSREGGVTAREIEGEFPGKALAEIVYELNGLLREDKIDIYKHGDAIYYKANREQIRFASKEEKMVYLLVKEAGRDGVWIKDIKVRSKLHQNLITKILRALEQRAVIKTVRSAKQSNRKLYMLYDITPSEALSGGPWFSLDAEIDVLFIEAIKNVLAGFLSSKTQDCGAGLRKIPPLRSLPTLQEMHLFIAHSGVSSVPLAPADIARLLRILVFERRVARLNDRGTERYIALR